jgi:hypothetical protein
MRILKENIVSIIILISAIFIATAYQYGYNTGRQSYEREIVYCIASESSCTVNNMIISKAADGRNFVSFNYKPFDRKEKK